MSPPLEQRVRDLVAGVDEITAGIVQGALGGGAQDSLVVAELLESVRRLLTAAGVADPLPTTGTPPAAARTPAPAPAAIPDLAAPPRDFQDLFQSAPAAMLVTDPAALIEMANDPAAELLGVEAAHLVGKPLSVFLDAASQSTMFRMIEQARHQPVTALRRDLVLHPRSAPSTSVTATVTNVPIEADRAELRWLVEEGIATRRFDTLTDIEQQLLSANNQLHAIVESAGDAIVSIDQDAHIVLFNRAAEVMTGWTSDEALGGSAFEIFPNFLEPPWADLVAEFLEEPDRWRNQVRSITSVRRSGEEFPTDVHLSRARYDDHEIFTVIARDTSAREAMLRELRAAEEFARQIIDNFHTLVIVTDTEGRILVFNRACEKLTGYTADEVRNLYLWDIFFLSGERNAQRRSFEGRLARTEPMTFELDWTDRFGGSHRVRWTRTVITDAEGRPTQVMGSGVDITNELALEAQLLAAQRIEAIGQLAGGIAHDFNNVLSIVLGHLDLLEATEPLSERGQARLAAATAAISRGAALVANLASLNRGGDSGGTAVADLNHVAATVGELLADMLGRASLHFELDPHLPLAAIESTRFEQVLVNLVLNAQAAMPEGGGITVRTLATPTAAWPEPGALVIVVDDGFGMDPDTARRAFDPLFTTKISGTGLGLATAKMVTEAAGGSIDLESHAGIGTAVSIWLPAVVLEPPTTPSAEARTGPAQAEPTADGAAEPASSDAVTRSGTVLVVDDQPELLAVVRDLLADIGFQVVTATNGGDAVRAASSFDVAPDLLLTDLVMPELDGYEVTDRLTAQFPGLAVVFMTAHADREVVGDQTERARYPILRKPFSRDELIDAVRAALG